MALRTPTADELRDPDKRERYLAEVTVAVATGDIGTKQARCIRDLCKEMRDNTDLRWMTRMVQRGMLLMKELLARKGNITGAEVDGYCQRWMQDPGGDDAGPAPIELVRSLQQEEIKEPVPEPDDLDDEPPATQWRANNPAPPRQKRTRRSGGRAPRRPRPSRRG